jgi:hypothetical protein
MKLNALSLCQPWASLLLEPNAKVHETRHWRAPNRIIGDVLVIHAAKRKPSIWDIDDSESLARLCVTLFGTDWRKNLPYGSFVGEVILTDCLRTTDALPFSGAAGALDLMCGDFTCGRYAWKTADRVKYTPSIPARGHPGLWRVDDTEVRPHG